MKTKWAFAPDSKVQCIAQIPEGTVGAEYRRQVGASYVLVLDYQVKIVKNKIISQRIRKTKKYNSNQAKDGNELDFSRLD
jgi:hypothetical protein